MAKASIEAVARIACYELYPFSVRQFWGTSSIRCRSALKQSGPAVGGRSALGRQDDLVDDVDDAVRGCDISLYDGGVVDRHLVAFGSNLHHCTVYGFGLVQLSYLLGS